jgi:malate/lactate dehydrogenase
MNIRLFTKVAFDIYTTIILSCLGNRHKIFRVTNPVNSIIPFAVNHHSSNPELRNFGFIEQLIYLCFAFQSSFHLKLLHHAKS